MLRWMNLNAIIGGSACRLRVCLDVASILMATASPRLTQAWITSISSNSSTSACPPMRRSSISAMVMVDAATEKEDACSMTKMFICVWRKVLYLECREPCCKRTALQPMVSWRLKKKPLMPWKLVLPPHPRKTSPRNPPSPPSVRISTKRPSSSRSYVPTPTAAPPSASPCPTHSRAGA